MLSSGQEVLTQTIRDTKTEIDISNFASGVYFVKLINDNQVELRKIIKE
jgi:hypothetical protein